MLVKISADNTLKYFSYFSKKIGSDTSCKLSPKQIMCMKCKTLFSRKNNQNITNLSSAEPAHSVVSVNESLTLVLLNPDIPS